MPEAEDGKKWMLTAVDVCTRWAFVQPMNALDSQEAAQIVLENWGKVVVFFNPRWATHDGGAEFKGIFGDMCAVLKVERHVSLHDRPAGHGIIERFNRGVWQVYDLYETLLQCSKQYQPYPSELQLFLY